MYIEKRADGGYDKFILKYFPEGTSANQKKLEVNNCTVWSKDFSGDIQMVSWDEELSTGWFVRNGEKVYTYFLKSNSGKKSRSNANASLNCTPIMEEVCINWGDDEGEITCGGGYCDIPEFGIECFDIIAYEDPACSDQYNPGSGPGTYTGPGGGGGSGGGTGGGTSGPTLLPDDEEVWQDYINGINDPDAKRVAQLNYLLNHGGSEFVDMINELMAVSGLTMGDISEINQLVNRVYLQQKGSFMMAIYSPDNVAQIYFLP